MRSEEQEQKGPFKTTLQKAKHVLIKKTTFTDRSLASQGPRHSLSTPLGLDPGLPLRGANENQAVLGNVDDRSASARALSSAREPCAPDSWTRRMCRTILQLKRTRSYTHGTPGTVGERPRAWRRPGRGHSPPEPARVCQARPSHGARGACVSSSERGLRLAPSHGGGPCTRGEQGG